MKGKDVKCPLCGKINRNVYLEDSDGWMECEGCGRAVQVMSFSSSPDGKSSFRVLLPLSRK